MGFGLGIFVSTDNWIDFLPFIKPEGQGESAALKKPVFIVIAPLVDILPAFDPVKIFFILRCWQGNFLDSVVVCVFSAKGALLA